MDESIWLAKVPALVAAVWEAMSVVDLLAMELRTVLRRMAWSKVKLAKDCVEASLPFDLLTSSTLIIASMAWTPAWSPAFKGPSRSFLSWAMTLLPRALLGAWSSRRTGVALTILPVELS